LGGAAPAAQVPKVGGRQLDLHVLYCSVTALGGCEEVIARKQWRVRSNKLH
jgi:ARID/BRIGHT DNA binding domain